jgi:hypothetical protein
MMNESRLKISQDFGELAHREMMLRFAWLVRREDFFGHVTRKVAQLNRDGSRRINVQLALKKIAATNVVGHRRVIEDAVHGILQNCELERLLFHES